MRVDFYILGDANEERRLHYVCRLTDKAWRLGHTVWIHVPSGAHADTLDARLWTFDPDGFLPHERNEDGDLSDCPVIIGTTIPATSAPDLLINEQGNIVDDGCRATRIAEVVNQSPAIRDAGRSRYARYRDAGCELHHHRVD